MYHSYIFTIYMYFRDIFKEVLGRENIMLFVFGDHGMTSTGMKCLISVY